MSTETYLDVTTEKNLNLSLIEISKGYVNLLILKIIFKMLQPLCFRCVDFTEQLCLILQSFSYLFCLFPSDPKSLNCFRFLSTVCF